jgi:hypothetical protein
LLSAFFVWERKQLLLFFFVVFAFFPFFPFFPF